MGNWSIEIAIKTVVSNMASAIFVKIIRTARICRLLPLNGSTSIQLGKYCSLKIFVLNFYWCFFVSEKIHGTALLHLNKAAVKDTNLQSINDAEIWVAKLSAEEKQILLASIQKNLSQPIQNG